MRDQREVLPMSVEETDSILKAAEVGIAGYLQATLASGSIDRQLYNEALKYTFPNLQDWLTDPHVDRISSLAKQGIRNAIQGKQWGNIVNAYRQSMSFGTGGIRGMMAFDKPSISKLKEHGVDTDILKGPNMINDLVILMTSAGVAKYGKDQKPKRLEKVVIGYDSRVRGHDFAALVAQLFLAYDYTVYFFDAP